MVPERPGAVDSPHAAKPAQSYEMMPCRRRGTEVHSMECDDASPTSTGAEIAVPAGRGLGRPWLWAAVTVLLVLGWQAATVHVNYAGHWTGLFRVGHERRLPDRLAQSTLRNSNPSGYDGQFYRLIAHDPFLQSGTAAYLDAPLLRSQRILVPVLAWIVAMGRDDLVDGAYVLVVAAFLFGGVFWLGSLAVAQGRHAALGLLFLIVPATIVAVDSMTVDVALAALTACFAWQVKTGRERWVWVTLAAACLVRETGLLLVIAAVVAAAIQRNFRRAAFLATAAIPMFCWYGYLMVVLPPAVVTAGVIVPGWVVPRLHLGILERTLDPPRNLNLSPAFQTIAHLLDRLALGATMGAIILGILRLRRTRPSSLQAALAMYLLILLAMTRKGFWSSPYGYSRPLAPLFVLLLVGDGTNVACCGIAAAAVCALVDLRILAEFRSQALSVLRWVTGG